MANPNKQDSQLADRSGNAMIGAQQSLIADLTLSGAGAVVVDSTTVDSSAGGTGETTNCTLIPAGSILLGVEAKVVTPMDGDTTTTLEVGVSGNADAYIDTSDFDPSAAADTVAGSASGTNNDIKTVQYLGAATQTIATWTNTDNMTAGDTTVTVVYVPLNSSNTLVDDTVNSILDILEAHGLMSDS